MAELGFAVPVIRHEEVWTAWRNVLEHWDDEARGTPIRAKKKWEQSGASGDPGSRYVYDGDGIFEMNGISVRELQEDLAALLDAVQRLYAEAFDEEWPDAECAAAFMRLNVDTFLRLRSAAGVLAMNFTDRGMPGSGVRYDQSGLKRWKDTLVAAKAWPLDPDAGAI